MNWLLVTVLIFWGVIAFTGFHKGFLRMLFSVSALIISLILTIALSPMVENLIYDKTEFDEFLTEKYVSFLDKENTDTTNDSSYFESLTSNFVSDPDSFGIDDVVSVMKDDVENVTEAVGEITNEVIAMLAGKLASITISVLAFIITWIVISLLLGIILGVIKVIEKIPVIKGANRILGFVLGSILALFIIWAVFALVAAIPATELGISFRKCIMENEFLKLINNSNILLKLI